MTVLNDAQEAALLVAYNQLAWFCGDLFGDPSVQRRTLPVALRKELHAMRGVIDDLEYTWGIRCAFHGDTLPVVGPPLADRPAIAPEASENGHQLTLAAHHLAGVNEHLLKAIFHLVALNEAQANHVAHNLSAQGAVIGDAQQLITRWVDEILHEMAIAGGASTGPD